MNQGAITLDSTDLDFGPVTEFTDAGRSIVVRNTGAAPLTISAVTIEQDGGEFTVVRLPGPIGVSGSGNIDLDFSPLGAGDDHGVAVISSDDPETPVVRVNLHGGPIWPALAFEPDAGFLAFAPTSMALTSKHALLRSAGGATLTVTSVGVVPTGNPDFSIVRPALPAVLRPGQSVPVQVDYSRSSRNTEGLMSVNSDDADAGRRTLRLLPDPAAQCSDQLDNDGDGLTDFPDDPGCSAPNDPDEYNDPECVDGAMRSCGSSVGVCRPGTQLCMSGAFYPCDGGVKAGAETCNGLDDDCSGVTDEGITEVCNINGCPGARLCIPDSGVAGGAYGTCLPVMTGNEVCNGLDDDCDGQRDEGIAETCMINGCLGTRLCIPGGDGGFTACAAANPATETCNGLDDDCDGTIDDVMPALQTCGFGVCARTAPACVDGGMPMCTPGMGGMEICNGIDDDCDGTPDDGLGTSTCGVGACFRSVPACTADGGMNVCVPGPQSAETCNDVDDDCDMSTDEGLTTACYDAGLPATRNVGRCRDGMATCAAGVYGVCAGQVGPVAEVCGNGIDDDCAAGVDNGCGSCNPNGLYVRDGGAITYTCCFGLVTLNVSQFQILSNGTTVIAGPSQNGAEMMSGEATTCPAGNVRAAASVSGGCTETFTIDGGFVGPNEWRGTYRATFTGTDCGCFGGIGTPCTSQSWPVQAFRQ
ncbi:MAG: choice-of-anchor D domain-containing protein [Myxococcaceae bacterium]|nr:choice-of-anchor D domain-containing protein [Myxococcaceae bacterium]